MVVKTRASTWVIPPQRAVWVPSRVDHETRTIGQVAMRTIYIAEGTAKHLLRECCAINVSPLLRELILRAAEAPPLYERRGPVGRLMRLILDEIRVSRMLPLHLPTPAHPQLASLCERIEIQRDGGGRALQPRQNDEQRGDRDTVEKREQRESDPAACIARKRQTIGARADREHHERRYRHGDERARPPVDRLEPMHIE